MKKNQRIILAALLLAFTALPTALQAKDFKVISYNIRTAAVPPTLPRPTARTAG